jgi:carbonic anhydrase/acetyltransferase-like protein (isoleucine patch superfamily)
VVVVCIGDSITFGQLLTDHHKAWPILLEGYEIRVAGVPGDTTRLGLERFPKYVQTQDATAVIIQFGHNDANRWETDRGLPRVSASAFAANLEEMIDRCRVFGSIPFLCSLTPSKRSEAHAEDTAYYDKLVRKVADRAGRPPHGGWASHHGGGPPRVCRHCPGCTRPQAEVMIHPTAIIHPDTDIHPSVTIEPYCIVGSDHGHLRLGPGSIIRSHSVIEGGSSIGDGFETGHHVLVRTGNEIGVNLRIGTMSRLEGGGVIGDYVRIHGDCEMTKGVIRDFARVYGGSYITDNRLPPSNVNEPAILDEGAVLTMNCVVVAGVRLGIGSFVGANSIVTKDVPDATALVGGKRKWVDELYWQGYSYPWTNYYRDGYPPESWPRIDQLNARILNLLGERHE